jgi:hypothetical protein
VRTCGDCTGNGGPRKIWVTNVIARDVTSTIVGINSNYGDVATIRNLTLNNSSTGKTKICQVFKGVVRAAAAAPRSAWNSTRRPARSARAMSR